MHKNSILFIGCCRAVQALLRLGARAISWPAPELLIGEGCLKELPERIKANGASKILIVSDKNIIELELISKLTAELDASGIPWILYGGARQDPTAENIEDAYAMYMKNGCDGIAAFGGGSPIDCAKGVCALVASPGKTIEKMKGLLKVGENVPPLFAVPTTSGTGSEATIAAVVSNPETHEKYAIADFHLVPKVAALDPALTFGLPPSITAMTGMDALTHAIEAYIGRSNTSETRRHARLAISLVFESLYAACARGEDAVARRNMQRAAFEAGIAFTRAYVGNVHAIAHTLGGFYGMPHGLANAVVLPYVLDYYGKSVYESLEELADLISAGDPRSSAKVRAEAFIRGIRELNAKIEIPEKLEGIQNEDIPEMCRRAFKEANPLYPVPRIFSEQDFYAIIKMVQG
ncbi:MAG: iron-containing alcohol dehydrogenase [Clostridiales bacterium]|jgi:alcohol dehydrogenase class IV|nr:iron-containing alcohol dehydrogenase [Clostridiales bacterium]